MGLDRGFIPTGRIQARYTFHIPARNEALFLITIIQEAEPGFEKKPPLFRRCTSGLESLTHVHSTWKCTGEASSRRMYGIS